MNRKLAVAAIVGGFVQAVGLLRGQEPQTPTRVPRAAAGEPVSPRLQEALSPSRDTALTREMADDLQRQITELGKRLSAVEQTQATTVGFSKSGNDLTLAPAGKVAIKAPGGVTLEGPLMAIKGQTGVTLEGASINVTASGQLIQKAAMIMLN